MKKILEYYRGDMLAPTGGPRGYLYGLKQGLDSINPMDMKIDFLPGQESMSKIRTYSKTSTNPLVRGALLLYRRLKHINNNLSTLNAETKPVVDLDDYDVIHFHSASEMYKLRREIDKYKGKIIFTSHSPQPSSNEYIESSSRLELFLFGKRYQELIEMDRYAFNRADYIIFPCEYAEEPYYSYWKEYSKIKARKADAYRYLLTGTFPAKVVTGREQIRNKLGIPLDAFVITYAGRHNEIKGYDKLKEIAAILLDKYSDIYFVIAGNLGPMNPMNHERWIEVGWTNEPHSYTSAGDVFVLPNKETYFDLVLLEVISTGTLLVASNTGGNKYFVNEQGIKLYNNVTEAVTCIEEIMNYTEQDKIKFQTLNKELYNKKFTPSEFARNFLNILKEI